MANVFATDAITHEDLEASDESAATGHGSTVCKDAISLTIIAKVKDPNAGLHIDLG